MKQLLLLTLMILVPLTAVAEKTSFYHADYRKKRDVLPNNERFYLVHNESMLLDLDFSDIGKWERKIGSMKSKDSNSVSSVSLKSLPELGMKVGEVIKFFDRKSGKVENYVIKETINLKKMTNPYDSEEKFISFNLMLKGPENYSHFNHMAYHAFESLAYKGSKYLLKPGLMTWPDKKTTSPSGAELQALTDYHKLWGPEKAKNLPVNVASHFIGDKVFITIDSSGASYASYFLKSGPSHYIHWNRPSLEFEDFHLYGLNIDGADLVGIYSLAGDYYVIIFYKDKIEKFFLFHDDGYQG